MELKFKWTRICTSGCTKIDFRGKLGDNSVLSYKTLIKYFQLPRYNQIWIFFPYIFLFHPILGIAFFHWCRPCQVLAAKVVFDLHISRMKTIMLLVHVVHMILHYFFCNIAHEKVSVKGSACRAIFPRAGFFPLRFIQLRWSKRSFRRCCLNFWEKWTLPRLCDGYVFAANLSQIWFPRKVVIRFKQSLL